MPNPKVVNPISGRKITVGGILHKRLCKDINIKIAGCNKEKIIKPKKIITKSKKNIKISDSKSNEDYGTEFEKGLNKIFEKGGIGDISDSRINSKVLNSMVTTYKNNLDNLDNLNNLLGEVQNVIIYSRDFGISDKHVKILEKLKQKIIKSISNFSEEKTEVNQEKKSQPLRGGALISYFGNKSKEARGDITKTKNLHDEMLALLNSPELVKNAGLTSQALEWIASQVEDFNKIIKPKPKTIKIKIKKIEQPKTTVKIKIKKPPVKKGVTFGENQRKQFEISRSEVLSKRKVKKDVKKIKNCDFEKKLVYPCKKKRGIFENHGEVLDYWEGYKKRTTMPFKKQIASRIIKNVKKQQQKQRPQGMNIHFAGNVPTGFMDEWKMLAGF